MHIVQVLGGYLPYPFERGGSVETLVYHLSKELTQANQKVTVITRLCEMSSPGVMYLPPLVSKRGDFFDRIFGSIRYSINISKSIPILKPDIIHIHGGIHGYILSNFIKGSTIPTVLSIHNLYLASQNELERTTALILETATSRNVTVVTSETIWMKNLLQSSLKKEKIIHIPLGVPLVLPFSKVNSRKALGINAPKVLLYVGRIIPEKGLDVLIDAFDILHKDLRESIPLLAIAGPPNAGFGIAPNKYFRNIENKISMLGLTNYVRYFGQLSREKLNLLYSSADLVSVPSLFDATNLVALEAMSFGVPVVASRTGGLIESVIHHRTGLLVEPGNPYELAEAIWMLIMNEDLLNQFSRNSVQHVRTKHSWNAISNSFMSLYESLSPQ
jgi:1,4-alpha-glucan branching enzyme